MRPDNDLRERVKYESIQFFEFRRPRAKGDADAVIAGCALGDVCV